MQGRWLEWDSFSTIALSGQSGSGKTSTVRFITAQLLLNNVSIYVCDPHGNAGNGSLKESILPLEPFLAQPIAVTLEERMQAFRAVHKIWRARKDGTDTSKHKIAIILDEATSHFIESSKEQVDELATILQSLTNEGRKNNIRCFLLSQNWRSDFIGSRSVRSSITHVIFHRTAEAEIKLFVESMPAKERRIISSLAAGHIFVYPFMYQLRVPYISQDDIADFADRYRSRSPYRDHAHIHAESRKITQITETPKKPETKLVKAVKEIIRCKQSGMNKEDTIWQVFQIRKGGKSERWNIASRFYDNVIKRAYENT